MGHGPVIHKSPWHRREHPALVVAVISGHAWVSPNQLLMLSIHFPDVLIVCVGANIDRSDAFLDHFDETSRDVAALAFRLEDNAAAMRGTRIRTEHHEEIWKVRHGETEIGSRVIVGPRCLEIFAVTPADVEPCRHLRDLEARRN